MEFVFRGCVCFCVQQLVHFFVRVSADVIGIGNKASTLIIGVPGVEPLLVHRMGGSESPGHEGGLSAFFHDFAESYGGVQRVKLDFQAALARVFLQLAQSGSQGRR